MKASRRAAFKSECRGDRGEEVSREEVNRGNRGEQVTGNVRYLYASNQRIRGVMGGRGEAGLSMLKCQTPNLEGGALVQFEKRVRDWPALTI